MHCAAAAMQQPAEQLSSSSVISINAPKPAGYLHCAAAALPTSITNQRRSTALDQLPARRISTAATLTRMHECAQTRPIFRIGSNLIQDAYKQPPNPTFTMQQPPHLQPQRPCKHSKLAQHHFRRSLADERVDMQASHTACSKCWQLLLQGLLAILQILALPQASPTE
jgi:hypothetical protein